MKRRCHVWLFAVAWSSCLLAGCVERRYVILSDPPGAVVKVNGKTVGAAPIDQPIHHYGDHLITLDLDGYETQTVLQPICSPWYEYIGLDFFSENVWPWTIRDLRTFTYKLEPARVVPPEPLLDRAGQLRSRGLEIGTIPPGAPPGPESTLPQIPANGLR